MFDKSSKIVHVYRFGGEKLQYIFLRHGIYVPIGKCNWWANDILNKANIKNHIVLHATTSNC